MFLDLKLTRVEICNRTLFRTWEQKTSKVIAVNSAPLCCIANNVSFETGCFIYHFHMLHCGNIVQILLRTLTESTSSTCAYIIIISQP